jgi:uncharacterized protein YodC (DUF2158 family)
MTNQFKAGDVVQLKSGGPEMTVTDVGIEEFSKKMMVWCMWFEKTKQLSGSFPVEAVDKKR